MGASIKLERLQRLSWIVPLAVPQSSARRSLPDASYCRSGDVPNLWICKGSVFRTGVNPSLTFKLSHRVPRG
jgi:hypothetical protein